LNEEEENAGREKQLRKQAIAGTFCCFLVGYTQLAVDLVDRSLQKSLTQTSKVIDWDYYGDRGYLMDAMSSRLNSCQPWPARDKQTDGSTQGSGRGLSNGQG